MRILACRMTEVSGRNRDAQGVHRLCTGCAPFWCIAVILSAGTAQAGTAWDMFVARCLDPFEHQGVAITDGLPAQPVDQMHRARRVFGPSRDGHLLVLDAAPSVGERSCGVEAVGQHVSPAATAWRAAQVVSARYVVDGAWLVSNEWIEPRVMVRQEMSAARTVYAVVETDLES